MEELTEKSDEFLFDALAAERAKLPPLMINSERHRIITRNISRIAGEIERRYPPSTNPLP
jgi:hypothetical protein